MTKNDLVRAVFDGVDPVTKRYATQTVELVFETIKDALASGESVKLHGFGTFTTKDKKSRVGRNPQTGEPMVISPRTVVRFTTSEVLKDKLNRQDES